MIDYQRRGRVPAKHHTQLHRSDGGVYHEECFARDRSDGAYSILYHAFASPDGVAFAPSDHGWAEPVEAVPEDDSLRARTFQTLGLPSRGPLLESRIALLFNDDLVVSFARPSVSDTAYFANGDGDDLAFVFRGEGRVESSFGWLAFSSGDYVWIPRGTLHRWHFERADNHVMVIEARRGVRLPAHFFNARGQLDMAAPYSHRDFVRPEGFAWSETDGAGGAHTIVIKRRGRFREHVMRRHPLDVIGWDGFVYPVAFQIEKFQAKAGMVHLPTAAHATFEGNDFVVASLVPRVVDFHPLAIPSRRAHGSVDRDVIVFHARGTAPSRDGIAPGTLALLPAGVPSPPAAESYEKSAGMQRTDELAVCVSVVDPLRTTANALALEKGA